MLHVNAFIVVGRGETQMTPIVRYTYSGDTYSSRVLGICHTTQIADQLKSIGCEKIFLFVFHGLLYEYSGNVVKIRFLPVRVVAKDL